MRYLLYVFMLFVIVSCDQNTANQAGDENLNENAALKGSYGEPVSMESAVPVSELKNMLSSKDSLSVKLTGEIAASCQSSGCWMDLAISDEDTLTVTFKDYAFVIPKDSKGKTTYIEGVAHKELVSVETLRNKAAEQGKSKEEIAAINEPEWAYTFEAKGVLIKENEE